MLHIYILSQSVLEIDAATSLVEVGSAGGSRGPIVFPVLLGRSRIQSYTRTHSMGTAIATGNARCLIYPFWPEDVGVRRRGRRQRKGAELYPV